MTPSLKDSLFKASGISLRKAEEKHPTFPAVAFDEVIPLDAIRQRNDIQESERRHTISGILLEEVYEFLEALESNDYEAMLSEAGDIVAVLLRALAAKANN